MPSRRARRRWPAAWRSWRAGLRLAGRTPERHAFLGCGATPRVPVGLDYGAAPAATPAGPAVHPGLLATGRVAGRDLAGVFLVRFQQPPCEFDDRLEIARGADRPRRAEATQEQDFGLIEVADAGQIGLVQQRLADRPPGRGAQPAYGLGGVPVVAQQVRTQMADHALFRSGRQDLDDSQLVPDGLPFGILEYQPDPVIARRRVLRGPDPPGTVHPQVRVNGDCAVDPDEQVLAARDGLEYGAPGEVGCREPGDPEIAAGQLQAAQRPVELAGDPPDHVSLWHGSRISPGPERSGATHDGGRGQGRYNRPPFRPAWLRNCPGWQSAPPATQWRVAIVAASMHIKCEYLLGEDH